MEKVTIPSYFIGFGTQTIPSYVIGCRDSIEVYRVLFCSLFRKVQKNFMSLNQNLPEVFIDSESVYKLSAARDIFRHLSLSFVQQAFQLGRKLILKCLKISLAADSCHCFYQHERHFPELTFFFSVFISFSFRFQPFSFLMENQLSLYTIFMFLV